MILDLDDQYVKDKYAHYMSRTIRTESGCAIWQGTKDINGYAKASLFGRGNSPIRVHIFIAQVYYGIAELITNPNDLYYEGQQICHKCDTPSCIEPLHLFVCTQSENMKDCYSKGRIHPPPQEWIKDQAGSKNKQARLTEEQVIAIREEAILGDISQANIAQKYGISQAHVSMIKNNQTWVVEK